MARAPNITRRDEMQRLLTAIRRLDDHWLGDLIGVLLLFGLIPLVLFLGTCIEGIQQ
ncbi:MAG: hypothetical protein ACK4TJ_05385 [Tabrizicola sp.]